MRILKLLVLLLCLAGLPLAVNPAKVLAQPSDGLTMTISAGFDGHYKEGKWFPVRIVLENQGSDLEGTVQVRFSDAGTGNHLFTYPLSVPSTSRKEVTLVVYPQGYGRELEVSFLDGKKTILKQVVQVNQVLQNDDLYGVVASKATAFNVLTQVSPVGNSAQVARLDLLDIPEHAQALAGLDYLFFANVDTGLLTPAQRQAIQNWIASGGNLILAGGVDWRKTTTGFIDSDLLPLKPTGTGSIKDLSVIDAFSQSSFHLGSIPAGVPLAIGDLGKDVQVLISGTAESGQEASPIVVRKPMGYGQVIFFAFDPTLPPFSTWEGREDFYRQLFTNSPDRPSWQPGIRNWDQAKEAAQTLLRLGLPSPWLICGFLLVYILVIGPLNYLLLRKLKRREMGWISIPLLVVGFSTLVILVGIFSRGSQPILNRTAVIQAWEGISIARVDGMVGIYSPTRSSYQVESNDPFLLHPIPDTTGIANKSYTVRQTSETTSISQVQIDISGITSFAFEGYLAAPQISQDLKLRIGQIDTLLQGNVVNNSQVNLEDAILLAPGSSQKLGDLKPGETKSISISLVKSQHAGEATLNPGYQIPFGKTAIPVPYTGLADSTLDEIIGTNNYYDDRENYRRYALVSAAMNYYYSSGSSRGVGFYLVGWSKELPEDIHLVKSGYISEDTAVYIIALKPTFEIGDEVALTPGMYSWKAVEGTDLNISPYDLWLYSGITYTLEFTPITAVEFSQVKSLTLHLEQPGVSGVMSGLTLSIWNFKTSQWEQLKYLRWSDNKIQEPDELVGSGGQLKLRIEAGPTTSFQIARSDFTLIVKK